MTNEIDWQAALERERAAFMAGAKAMQEAAAKVCAAEADHPANKDSPNFRSGARACASAIRAIDPAALTGQPVAPVVDDAVIAAFRVGVWTEEERDGMAAAFKSAEDKHGFYETLFSVGAWLLRHRYASLKAALSKEQTK